MVTFQEVNTLDELDNILNSYRNKGWETSETENILQVNDQCRTVSRFFCGKSYLAGGFATKAPTTIEKVVRIALGLLVTVISLGVALCFQAVRDLFSTRVEKICFAFFNKDSGPNTMLSGMKKSHVTALKVDRECRSGFCGMEHCEDLHACAITMKDGQTYNTLLSNIQIRDLLECLEPGKVNADYNHFAHAGEIKI